MEMFEYIDIINKPYDIYMDDFLYPVKAHWHYYAEILYLTEGSVVVEFDTYSVTLLPGELLFIYPKKIHSLHLPADAPADAPTPRLAIIKFDLNELNLSRVQTPWLRNIIYNAGNYPTPINHFTKELLEGHPIQKITEGLIEEMECGGQIGSQINISSYLNMLLVNLIRIWQSQGIEVSSNNAEVGSNSMVLETIIEYIDNHSNETIRVSELAGRCNMSYSNFARLFKRMYGRSCKEYIEYIRVMKAHDMLIYTNFPLNYISEETGFYDCSHFIRTYKKIMGVTPHSIRQ